MRRCRHVAPELGDGPAPLQLMCSTVMSHAQASKSAAAEIYVPAACLSASGMLITERCARARLAGEHSGRPPLDVRTDMNDVSRREVRRRSLCLRAPRTTADGAADAKGDAHRRLCRRLATGSIGPGTGLAGGTRERLASDVAERRYPHARMLYLGLWCVYSPTSAHHGTLRTLEPSPCELIGVSQGRVLPRCMRGWAIDSHGGARRTLAPQASRRSLANSSKEIRYTAAR